MLSEKHENEEKFDPCGSRHKDAGCQTTVSVQLCGDGEAGERQPEVKEIPRIRMMKLIGSRV